MRAWARGWRATLRMMVFDRETWRFLRDLGPFREEDFAEALPPAQAREGR